MKNLLWGIVAGQRSDVYVCDSKLGKYTVRRKTWDLCLNDEFISRHTDIESALVAADEDLKQRCKQLDVDGLAVELRKSHSHNCKLDIDSTTALDGGLLVVYTVEYELSFPTKRTTRERRIAWFDRNRQARWNMIASE